MSAMAGKSKENLRKVLAHAEEKMNPASLWTKLTGIASNRNKMHS
jgi:hypothetical protein